MTRRVLVLVVLGAVVLAGCSGGPTETTASEPTDSGTPATSPIDDGGTTDVSSEGIPGVTDGSLANATALVRANEASLSQTGGEVRTTRSDGDDETEYRLVAGSGLSTYTLSGTRSFTGQTTAIELWSNETTRFIRTQSESGTNYRTAERRHDRLNILEMPEDYLAAGEFTVANESTGDGTVVLTADEYVPPTDGHGPFADVTSFSGRLVVDESGRIHNLTVSAVDEGQTVTYRFELVRTGVERVAKPDWFDDVPASATLQPELTVDVENSSYLAIRNEGGDDVPRNSSISLTTNGTTGNATFETALTAGSTRYAYFRATDGDFRLTADRPAAAVVDPVTSPVSVTITTEDGVSLYSASMGWDSETASAEESGSASTGGSSSTGSASETTTPDS